jgi:hypothetical protein
VSDSTRAAETAGPIGGASGDAGVEFRRAVAAYAVAHALAGQPLGGFGVPLASATVREVAIETDEHADDIRIAFDGGHVAQVQAKRTLRFGPPFANAVAQWVGAAKEGLDLNRDRLVLVAGTVSGPIASLSHLLERLKTDSPGQLTAGERDLLARLDALLPGLNRRQRDVVHKCAVITVLPVEDEQSALASSARTLLAQVVGAGQTVARCWRDLVAHCGRVGRLRGGFRVEGWVRLLQEDGYQIASGETPAATAALKSAALDRYREVVRLRGRFVDLRPLGADAAKIPIEEIDAAIKCVPPGADRREDEVLPWSLLRRGRVLLTGLPGGGKSVALAVAASTLVDAAGAPLPILVSLPDVELQCAALSFADRVLNTAVRDLPTQDRPLVRTELERGLSSGGTALLLDSLDETHDRRGAVVAEIANLCQRLNPEVPILLATRDVAYAQAASLAWDDLRLQEPGEPGKAVAAVLSAVAAARGLESGGDWVQMRTEWVNASLRADRPLTETPLMPVLLALLAADRADGHFPATRAQILIAAVEAAVRRREAQRDRPWRIATLSGRDSANAALDGFAWEARIIGDSGGKLGRREVERTLAIGLENDWGLPPAAARSGAQALIHFWDELGVFVISGADEVISPRLELLLDIGDAVDAVKSPSGITEWVLDRISSRRLEPVVLAATLSQQAAEVLVSAAIAESSDTELLTAAVAALEQHAVISPQTFAGFLAALARDAARGDRQGWSSIQRLVRLTQEKEGGFDFSSLLANYPHEHQVVIRTAIALAGKHVDESHDQLLLECLAIQRMPQLPERDQSGASPATWATADRVRSDVTVAAAKTLLGRVEAATGLVVALLEHSSVYQQRRLLSCLEAAGLADAAADVVRRQTSRFAEALKRFAEYDHDEYTHFLEHLCQLSQPTTLTEGEANRLDELATLFATLDLNDMSSWPRGKDQEAWLKFVASILEVGGFDRGRLSGEALVCHGRVTHHGHEPFFALEIASQRKSLDQWANVSDQTRCAQHLTHALFLPRGIARTAALALSSAPQSIARPLLERALPQLISSRDHHYFAAHALAEMIDETTLLQWAESDQPSLRHVAVDRLPIEVNGQVNPLIVERLDDTDRRVASASVKRVGNSSCLDANALLSSVIDAVPRDWECTHCSTQNPGSERACSECHILPPDPHEIAAELLAKRAVRDSPKSE